MSFFTFLSEHAIKIEAFMGTRHVYHLHFKDLSHGEVFMKTNPGSSLTPGLLAWGFADSTWKCLLSC